RCIPLRMRQRGRFVLHRSHGIRCCCPCFEAKEERRKSEEQPIKSPQNTLVEQKFRRAKYPIPENGRYEKEIRHLKTGLHRKLRIKSECNLPKNEVGVNSHLPVDATSFLFLHFV